MTLHRSIVNMLVVLCCVSCAATSGRTHGRGGSSAPVPVAVELHFLPDSLLAVKRSDFKAEEAQQLQKSKLCFQTKLDLKKGLPIAAFAPQGSARHVRMVDALGSSGETHVWADHYLDFLLPSSYHRVGYTHWYLVQKNPDGSIRAVVSDESAQRRRDNLVAMAAPGDMLLGGWSF